MTATTSPHRKTTITVQIDDVAVGQLVALWENNKPTFTGQMIDREWALGSEGRLYRVTLMSTEGKRRVAFLTPRSYVTTQAEPTTATDQRFPRPGDLVIVAQCEYVSGAVSSVPFTKRLGEVLGTLVKVSDTEYEVVDDGQTLARIHGVYSVREDDLDGRLFLDGWIGDKWGCWIASN